MSEKMGPLAFGKKEEQIFLGREMSRHTDYSEETARDIDSEVRRFVTAGYDKAKEICSQHKDQIERLAQALLEHESLTADNIDQVMRGETIVMSKKKDSSDGPDGKDKSKEEKEEKKKVKKTSTKPATDSA